MQDRPADPALSREAPIARMAEECHRYSFFQLLRLLGRALGGVMPGGTGPAARERVRLRPSASMGFPRCAVESVELPSAASSGGRPSGPLPSGGPLPEGLPRAAEPFDGEPPEAPEGGRAVVTVNFMGLYGPSSPLPNHFTEEILWAGADGAAARDFLDLFHHRLISFVYRAWEKYRYPMQYRAGGEDRHSRRVLSLLGLGTAGAGGAAGIPAASVLRIAGLLRSRARSAAGLEAALRDHTGGLPIRVVPFVSRRASVPPDQRARLGRGTCRLGETACLGERVLDSAGAFEIAIGPLSCEDYRRFLPGGDALDRLVRLVRFYVPDPLHFHVRLRTRDGEAPRLALAPSAGLPLGRMSWLAPRPLEAGEAVVPVRDSDPLHRARAVAAPADSGLGQRRDSWSTSTSVS